MPLESPETHWRGLCGAELSVRPEGWHSVRIATPAGLLQARLHEAPGSPCAALLSGPKEFAETFDRLAENLAAGGITAASLEESALPVPDELRAVKAFLWTRGARRFAVAAAAEAAAPVAGCASAEWDLVALVAPTAETDSQSLERLRGRPLVLLCGDDASTACALAAHARAPFELVALPSAGREPNDVCGELCSALVPRISRALQQAVRNAQRG